jgi:hypothetical protein
MYPVGGIGVLFELEDIPESARMINNNTVGGALQEFVLEKNIGGNAGPFEYSIYGNYGQFGQGPAVLAGFGEYHLAEAQAQPGQGECLFNDKLTETPTAGSGSGVNFWLFDEFSDTYEATCTITAGGQTIQTTRTYTREHLCVWRSRNQNGDVDGELYYRTLASVEEAERFGMGRILWSLSGVGFRTEGDGPYNSPAGRYGQNGQCVVTEA